MRKCRICDEVSDNFREHRRTCRKCENIYSQKYHKNNKEKINKRKVDKNSQRYTEKRLYIVEYLLNNPCVDCGESNPVVLEFDHVKGQKVKKISSIINYGMNTLKKEIAKCEVRCANCHAKVTAKRAGWEWAKEFLD